MRKILVVVLSVLALTGCGSSSQKSSKDDGSKHVELTQQTIDGDLSEYFEIVKKDYVISDANGNYPKLEITLKRTDIELPYNIDNVDRFGVISENVYVYLGLGLEIYDKNSIPVCIKPANKCYTDDIVTLSKLNAGEYGTFTYYIGDDKSKMNEFETFKITSAVKVLNKKGLISGNNKKVSSSNEWDSILNDYEKYINNYVSLSKKVMAGDVSVMSEYASCLEKANSLSDKLANAKGSMTTAQIKRLTKLQSKLASVAQ